MNQGAASLLHARFYVRDVAEGDILVAAANEPENPLGSAEGALSALNIRDRKLHDF